MTTRFRADHVGSLLRPAALLDARAAYASGQLGLEALRQAEDSAVLEALRLQRDDEHLEALKEELIEAERLAVDEQGKVLGWAGAPASAPPPAVPAATDPEPPPLSYTPPHLAEKIFASRAALAGERKQVTVLFGDIKDSTELIRSLDPEAAASRPGHSPHDGGRAPLRGHRQPGAGRARRPRGSARLYG